MALALLAQAHPLEFRILLDRQMTILDQEQERERDCG